MANEDIKEMLKTNKIPYWKIAKKLNISEATVVRKMRIELSKEEKQTIKNIVKKIKEE